LRIVVHQDYKGIYDWKVLAGCMFGKIIGVKKLATKNNALSKTMIYFSE